MMSSSAIPSLFGIVRSNRNFADPYYWGKNQFNSAFPVALACYMRAKQLPLVYVKFKDSSRTEVGELDISELFGSTLPCDQLYFAFEARFDHFRSFVHDELPPIDLVVGAGDPVRQLRPVEVKLTTAELSEEFRNSVTLRGMLPDNRQVSVSGTLTGPKQVPKLISVDGFDMEIPISEHMAFYRYKDRPGVIGVVGGLLGAFGRFGPASRRCLMWASGGSFFYGLSSALIKVISSLVKQGEFWQRPLFWTVVPFLLVCYVVGGWMVQQGYANGPAEIVVGSMTTTDPIVAVTFGMAVLGEGIRVGLWDAFGMLVAGVIAVGGVVILSIHHPDSLSNQAKNPAAGSRAADPVPDAH